MRDVVFVCALCGMAFLAGLFEGARMVMRQAEDRGYAEQCVGTTLRYWRGECPEVAE